MSKVLGSGHKAATIGVLDATAAIQPFKWDRKAAETASKKLEKIGNKYDYVLKEQHEAEKKALAAARAAQTANERQVWLNQTQMLKNMVNGVGVSAPPFEPVAGSGRVSGEETYVGNAAKWKVAESESSEEMNKAVEKARYNTLKAACSAGDEDACKQLGGAFSFAQGGYVDMSRLTNPGYNAPQRRSQAPAPSAGMGNKFGAAAPQTPAHTQRKPTPKIYQPPQRQNAPVAGYAEGGEVEQPASEKSLLDRINALEARLQNQNPWAKFEEGMPADVTGYTLSSGDRVYFDPSGNVVNTFYSPTAPRKSQGWTGDDARDIDFQESLRQAAEIGEFKRMHTNKGKEMFGIGNVRMNDAIRKMFDTTYGRGWKEPEEKKYAEGGEVEQESKSQTLEDRINYLESLLSNFGGDDSGSMGTNNMYQVMKQRAENSNRYVPSFDEWYNTRATHPSVGGSWQHYAEGGPVAPASPSLPPLPAPTGGSGMPPMGGQGGGEMEPPMPLPGASGGMPEGMGSLLTQGTEEGADMGGMEPPSGMQMIMENVGGELAEEEVGQLEEAFSTYPVLDKVMGMLPLDWEGSVAGPGGPTSDDIPARLSDGEFVFTAKAVEQIGVDKLQKMMADAEAKADGMPPNDGMNFKCGGLVKRRH